MTLDRLYGPDGSKYLDLIRRFPLRPLRSDEDLDAAIAVVDSLIDRDDLAPPEQDYLDVLGDLVEAYEDVHYPIDPVAEGELLRLLIGGKGVTQAQLAADTGIAESTVSEVLSGKRKLNRTQIGKLARYFRVEPGAFVFAR